LTSLSSLGVRIPISLRAALGDHIAIGRGVRYRLQQCRLYSSCYSRYEETAIGSAVISVVTETDVAPEYAAAQSLPSTWRLCRVRPARRSGLSGPAHPSRPERPELRYVAQPASASSAPYRVPSVTSALSAKPRQAVKPLVLMENICVGMCVKWTRMLAVLHGAHGMPPCARAVKGMSGKEEEV
jgi:hypothetical protein